MIFHITTQFAWETARRAGVYTGDSLVSEGFIHCSTAEQWEQVRAEWFPGRDDLVLLQIDPQLLSAEVRWEGGFPHLYGPLEVGAVVSARRL